jgi:hypothetical protein
MNDTAFNNTGREAELTLTRMQDALARLNASLELMDELTELISLCMAHSGMGNMDNPLPATMKMMSMSLPVWPDPSKNIDELEAARDREFAVAEAILHEIEEHAALCEELLQRTRESF